MMIHLLAATLLLGISHAICFWAMTEPKLSRRITALSYTGFVVMFECLVLLSYAVFGDSTGCYVSAFISTIVMALFVFILTSSDPTCKKIFLFISYANVFTIFACVSNILCSMIFKVSSETTAYYTRNIIRTLLFILMAFIYIRFLRSSFKAVSGQQRKIWYSISTVSILFLMIFASFLMIFSARQKDLSSYIPFFGGAVLLYASTLWVICGTIKFMIAEANSELINQNIAYLQEQLKTAKETELTSKTVRHDFRHHNRNLEAMLKKGEIQEALKYLKQYNDSLDDIKPNDFCPNITVNAILNSFYMKAQKNGISLSIEADTKEDTPISNMDFNAILSNLLENAINGSIECRSSGDIKVNIRTVDDKTVIVCSNPCRQDITIENNMLQNSGIGISSMLLAIRKYDGDIKYSYDNKTLTACIILNS